MQTALPAAEDPIATQGPTQIPTRRVPHQDDPATATKARVLLPNPVAESLAPCPTTKALHQDHAIVSLVLNIHPSRALSLDRAVNRGRALAEMTTKTTTHLPGDALRDLTALVTTIITPTTAMTDHVATRTTTNDRRGTGEGIGTIDLDAILTTTELLDAEIPGTMT